MTMVIKTESLLYSYTKGLPVLKDISIELPSNSIVSLIGPNGSGKTTLLKILSGLLRTNSVVCLDNTYINTFTDKQRASLFSYVGTNHEIYPSISVLDLLFLGIRANGDQNRWENRYLIADAIMKQFGITSLALNQFGSLSSGQKQLAMIARSIIQNPKVLFLDEPTANLDVVNQKMILDLLSFLSHNTGISIVVVLHDISQALKISDWIVGLKNGHIVFTGRPEDCITESSMLELFEIKSKIYRIEGELVLVY